MAPCSLLFEWVMKGRDMWQGVAKRGNVGLWKGMERCNETCLKRGNAVATGERAMTKS